MASSREVSTTESRQPTLRALPMYEVAPKSARPRASDVQPGGGRADKRRPAHERVATVPLPRAGGREATVTQLHGPGVSGASLRPPGPPLTPPRALGVPLTPPRALATPLTPESLSTQALPASTPRSTTAPAAPSLTPRSPLAHPLAGELGPSVRAYVDPATPSGARPVLTPYPTPVAPLVEVRTLPVLHFQPIEKAILILAGFSVIAVVISTIFHGG